MCPRSATESASQSANDRYTNSQALAFYGMYTLFAPAVSTLFGLLMGVQRYWGASVLIGLVILVTVVANFTLSFSAFTSVEISPGCVVLKNPFRKRIVTAGEVMEVDLNPPVESESLDWSWMRRQSLCTINLKGQPPVLIALMPDGLKLRIARALDPMHHSRSSRSGTHMMDAQPKAFTRRVGFKDHQYQREAELVIQTDLSRPELTMMLDLDVAGVGGFFSGDCLIGISSNQAVELVHLLNEAIGLSQEPWDRWYNLGSAAYSWSDQRESSSSEDLAMTVMYHYRQIRLVISAGTAVPDNYEATMDVATVKELVTALTQGLQFLSSRDS